ncbi:hypothetical protein Btru_056073 [Bulinus truncatus]|nr:hypothetical protein Btru_056073 [Bulinus truncatus]
MESEEAIMENENNCNVESQSNIRENSVSFTEDTLGIIDADILENPHSEEPLGHCEEFRTLDSLPSTKDNKNDEANNPAFFPGIDDSKDKKIIPDYCSSQHQNISQSLSLVPDKPDSSDGCSSQHENISQSPTHVPDKSDISESCCATTSLDTYHLSNHQPRIAENNVAYWSINNTQPEVNLCGSSEVIEGSMEVDELNLEDKNGLSTQFDSSHVSGNVFPKVDYFECISEDQPSASVDRVNDMNKEEKLSSEASLTDDHAERIYQNQSSAIAEYFNVGLNEEKNVSDEVLLMEDNAECISEDQPSARKDSINVAGNESDDVLLLEDNVQCISEIQPPNAEYDSELSNLNVDINIDNKADIYQKSNVEESSQKNGLEFSEGNFEIDEFQSESVNKNEKMEDSEVETNVNSGIQTIESKDIPESIPEQNQEIQMEDSEVETNINSEILTIESRDIPECIPEQNQEIQKDKITGDNDIPALEAINVRINESSQPQVEQLLEAGKDPSSIDDDVSVKGKVDLPFSESEPTANASLSQASVEISEIVTSVECSMNNDTEPGLKKSIGTGNASFEGPHKNDLSDQEVDNPSSENCDKTIDARDKNSDFNKPPDLQLSQNEDHESDDDLILVPEIKTEPLGDESVNSKLPETCIESIKIEQGSNDDEVVVLDDDGEIVPVKKEVDDCKALENGLGIQISEVSGQQHQLHANAESNESCRCKYNIVRNGDVKHLCDDFCFKHFRKNPSSFLKTKDPNAALKESLATTTKPTYQFPPKSISYKSCSVCQLMDLNSQNSFCNWKGLDFCGESCLGKYQATLNTTCSFCHAYIPMDMRASHCSKIGNDMRPFCNPKCISEFKKKLKLCTFCQKDIAAIPGAITANVGSLGTGKEFCSQICVKKLEEQLNSIEIISSGNSTNQDNNICAVCDFHGIMKHMFKFQGKPYKLCSDPCLSAFQYTNKIVISRCDCCGIISRMEETQAHFIQFEGQMKRFCSDACVNKFRKQNTKIVSCDWCSTNKLNFDMIERLDTENKYQMFCSLTCLSLYRVNHQAKSNLAVLCDQCKRVVPAQYHLTMSDASVRNFCSYVCVMTFQSQFTSKHAAVQTFVPPQQQSSSGAGQPAAQAAPRVPNSNKTMRPKIRQSLQKETSFPVISNVMSLAPAAVNEKQVQLPLDASSPPKAITLPMTGNIVSSGDGKNQILIQPPAPVSVKNKSLQCRPITQTKATSCKPHSQSKEIQTDEQAPKTIIIPVPVPVYVPMPTVMYTAPAPQIIPFPVPIPVPIFIPTTRKSANGILKTIKEIVERMPADPLEAEILMMAEAVAADGRQGDSDTDSDGDLAADDGFGASDDLRHQSKIDDAQMLRKRDGQGEEDMIQMALRMAEEMSGPIEDLESSVEPVAVNADPPGSQSISSFENQIDDEYIAPLSTRGAKRQSRGRPPSARSKRARLDRQSFAEDDTISYHSQANTSMEPPPDANYRLKFTYGVNAWRHWVINKNAQIEKAKQSSGSYRIRTFPTDILKCTTDELNFTMCMFVKEVRKPNGDVYSPDSIYYLCLGIQQYLYENSRIDNIFTDLYFEKFTDILHELLKNLQPKVNSQGRHYLLG